MPTYTVNWAAFNEVLDQLSVLQKEINTLNAQYSSGNSSALQEWTSEARDAFHASELQWTTAASSMEQQAALVQQTADKCRDEYQHAVQYGTQLWSK
ncbi:hypothetical protein AB0E75_22445 [Streptomyces griseoviridis]|jgi:hypothetical protein|uniref:WXG100 family type VII secretion target n=3 Tax=Streptomyces TaxID=1883 RepID=A0A918GTY6_STRGD|nr:MULTISPECIES: hypothetical protein [Streptomyces]MDP9685092.1 hypothetical protein [Streptomyces griseoviridis]GGS62873.1 hypothetical protein GCM10010238_59990 [Streptomyces niveoruber]GGT14799.1 hypothetical protein GCM10010240_55070 [Streptomyces griseoviridis]GGU59991.1 hypothetical protein GCM10010259_58500 [Streptomyces daghestanicus]GHI31990.1 hypothetical protein Sdagh_37200 [Streptomyces daghestanicus]